MSVEIVDKPRHSCGLCGCVFTFGKEDLLIERRHRELRQVSLKEWRDFHDCRLYISCPVCGTEHVLKTWEESEIKEKRYF